jgi:quercetin dioxygenase-like cupin family protein
LDSYQPLSTPLTIINPINLIRNLGYLINPFIPCHIKILFQMTTTTYPTVGWGKETFLPLLLNETACEFEWRVQPGGAVPTHLHKDSDEHFELLEGELTFIVAGKTLVKKAGESFTVPKMTPHSLHNKSKALVRCRVGYLPASDQSKFFQVLIFLKGEGVEGMGAMFRTIYICEQLGYREFSTMLGGMKLAERLMKGCFRLLAPVNGWKNFLRKYVRQEVRPHLRPNN